ncbi:DNA-processing protein DprA [Sporichthya brevicatena]|uniref:DNA-processing protein DprA n=1 Tax=Sporichthya brevicatena TaxID=171442 RepID=A0ABN1H7X6_9ACTN
MSAQLNLPLGPGQEALAALLAAAEPGDARLGTELDRWGPVELVRRVRTGCGGFPGAAALRRRLETVDGAEQLGRAAALDAVLVARGDPDWPTQLDDLGDSRPLALWLRGSVALRPALLRSAAVVGSRTASAYGLRVAADLGSELSERGWTVVSGAALGIDGAAHRGALAGGGPTVAVLASGLDVPYPVAHARLLDQIAEEGIVISESGFGTVPMRHRFLTRNRLIAALTRGTVVVEAAMRSGALSTARYAADLNRPLLAVPGPVTSTVSAGSNDLLRTRGAIPVTCAGEVIEDLGRIGADLAPARTAEERPHDALSRRQAEVIGALPARRPVAVDEVARRCGLDPAAASAELGQLALLGMVERIDGGWRPTRRGRGG